MVISLMGCGDAVTDSDVLCQVLKLMVNRNVLTATSLNFRAE